MKGENENNSIFQEIRDIFLVLINEEPTPDDEIEAREKLIKKFEDLKTMEAFSHLSGTIEEILNKLENWDTLDLWFNEVKDLKESIEKFIKIEETKDKVELEKVDEKRSIDTTEKKKPSQVDIDGIVTQVSEQFKGQIDNLQDKIKKLQEELEKKERKLTTISLEKMAQQTTANLEPIKLVPFKEPKLIPREEPKSVLSEKSKLIPREELKSVLSEKPKLIPREELKLILSEKPKSVLSEKPKSVLSEKPKSVLSEKPKLVIPKIRIPPIKKPLITTQIRTQKIVKSEIPSELIEKKSMETKQSKVKEEIEPPKPGPIFTKLPKIIPEVSEKPSKVSLMIEKPEEPSVVYDKTFEEPETPEELKKIPFETKKPKIATIEVEEEDIIPLKSSSKDLFNMFSSVGEITSETSVKIIEPADTILPKIKKKRGEKKKKGISDIGYVPSTLPFGFGTSEPDLDSNDDFSSYSVENIPKERETLYNELISLEGVRYSLEKSFKEIEKSYKKGSISDFEYNNQNEKIKIKLKNITIKINEVRNIISSL